MMRLCPGAPLLVSLLALNCGGSKPPEDMIYDFSGVAPLDLERPEFDAFVSGPDLAGYDLTCDPATALTGGDPTGHWSYYGACASGDALYQIQDTCVGLVIDNVVLKDPQGTGRAYGTLDLDSGGTFSRDSHVLVTAHATAPSSCTQPFGGCANFGTGESAQFNWLTMACTTTGSVCSCALSADLSKAETGSWTHTSTGYTTTGAIGGPQTFTFAASNNELRHHGDSTSLRGNRGITYVLLR